MIPAQHVKPFVRRGKSDRVDAAAIAEAAQRPDMAQVAVKSAERQAEAMPLRTCELLVKQRTRTVNALRGHAAEFGVVVAQGTGKGAALLAAKELIARLGQQVAPLDEQVEALAQQLLACHKANPVSRLLAGVPGIGPRIAVSLALTVEAGQCASGRHFAAWLGLTPQQNSTGGKTRLGKVGKAGHARLRPLLVAGASAVIRHARPGRRRATPWLLALRGRKPKKLAAVALANKMARIVWAMMPRGEAYRRQPVVA